MIVTIAYCCDSEHRLEGQKFKGRISFWTLRPRDIGGGGVIRPTEKSWELKTNLTLPGALIPFSRLII
jgi:hypothetical protein